jgi:hypothetical protein
MEQRNRHSPVSLARRGTRAIAAVVPKVTAALFRKRGFAEAGILNDWAAIVGPRLAAGCSPEKLSFPLGKRADGTLRLRVAGALATELQHFEPQLLERINGYFGYRAVARVKMVQGPLPPPKRQPDPLIRPLDREEAAALREVVSSIASETLRRALEGLGRAVMGRRPDR